MTKFLNLKYSYALVGASADQAKYGHIVFLDLYRAGFKVLPVNPKKPVIAGVRAVATVQDLQPLPDVVVFVVPPIVGVQILDDVAKLGIKKVWFQPGAESAPIKQRVKELKLMAVTDGSCIMIERKRLGFPDQSKLGFS